VPTGSGSFLQFSLKSEPASSTGIVSSRGRDVEYWIAAKDTGQAQFMAPDVRLWELSGGPLQMVGQPKVIRAASNRLNWRKIASLT
jgi:hypothetical protein